MFNYLRRVDFYEKIPHLVSIVVSFSLVLRPCTFFTCSTKFCTNFVMQVTNPQGLGTRLSLVLRLSLLGGVMVREQGYQCVVLEVTKHCVIAVSV